MPTNLVVRYLHGVRRVLLTFTGDNSNLNANEATARLRQFSTHSSATYENELLPIELTGAKFRPDGDALAAVQTALHIATDIDPNAWWMSWGTARSERTEPGRLNQLGKIV